MTVYDKHLADLIAAYRECRKMLAESQKLVEETASLLASLNAQPLDYPRCARVNYAVSEGENSDFPLAKFVRLISVKTDGDKENGSSTKNHG